MAYPTDTTDVDALSITRVAGDPNPPADNNAQAGVIKALAAKSGTGATTPVVNTVLRGTGLGTTAYAQVGLTTDVTGTLPVANGGTGNTTGAATISSALKSVTTSVDVSASAAPTTGQILTATSGTAATWQTVTATGNALTSNPLSQFAATTSAQLAGVLSDETGTGLVVMNTSPTLVTPILGTPTSGVATNLTGTAAGLTSGITTALKSATTSVDVSAAIAPTIGQALIATAGTTATWQTLAGGGNAQTANPLSQFAATTSAQLAGVLSDETGTGSVVMNTSPTLVTPILGTPTSGVATNLTGLPISTGVSGLATGIAAFLATPNSANLGTIVADKTGTGFNVFSTSPTLVTPVLGTPTSATLTNATGLPISTGVSGLGAGTATFLATPNSTNLGTIIADKTGTNVAVFNTSPTLVTPTITDLTNVNHSHLTVAGGGTITAAAVSNFDTQVRTSTLNQLAPPSIDLSVNSHKLTNVNDPTTAQDAATKNYVDVTAQGLNQKPTAIAATTTALPANTYANGTAGVGATLTATANAALSVDSYAVAINDIVLVKNEVLGANNGLYSVTSTGSVGTAYVLTRHTSMDSTLKFKSAFLAVDNLGVINSNSLWLNTNSTNVTVGTTVVTFSQLNKGTDLSPSTGITITGNVVAIDTTIVARKTDNLSVFAATTSAQFSGVITDKTGTGVVVMNTSPTLITPILGTPTSGVATNLTGLPISTGISGLAAGVATLLTTPNSTNLGAIITDKTGTNVAVFNTSPTLVTPVLGTPTSVTLTNATGLPISTGVSGLGTSVPTFLTTPNSANLGAIIADKTGTGSAVFNTSPTFVTPILGTPTSGVATNLTGVAAGLTTGLTTALKSVTTSVDVSASTAPTIGQVLTATAGTTATWQTPTAGAGDMVLASTQTNTGAKTFNDATLKLAGLTSGTATLKASSIAGTGIQTLPAATTTLVGQDTTDSLTNKTITSAKFVSDLLDSNGNNFIHPIATASAVNGLQLTNAATGGGVIIGAGGTSSDVNIDINVVPKGSGHTVITSPKIVTSGDTTGDTYYRDGSGNYVRLGIGAAATVLTVTAGLPSWTAPAGGGGGDTIFDSTKIYGFVKLNRYAGRNQVSGTGTVYAAGDDGALGMDAGTTADTDFAFFATRVAATGDWTKACKWRLVQSNGGLGHTTAVIKFGIAISPTSDINKHLGFRHNAADNLWYVSSADGTTETKTNVNASVTYGQTNVWDIVYTPSVSAIFSVNGVVLATITTNLPNTGAFTEDLGIYVGNNSGYSSFNEPTIQCNSAVVSRSM